MPQAVFLDSTLYPVGPLETVLTATRTSGTGLVPMPTTWDIPLSTQPSKALGVFHGDPAIAVAREIVFVDASVPDHLTLLQGLARDAQVIVLDTRYDGVAQMSAVLAGQKNITSLHIISHGAPGLLSWGSASLTSDTLVGYADLLQGWSSAFAPGADIALYGCDVAAGAQGTALLQQLSRLTGADITASTNKTGSAGLGGDWSWEAVTGVVETRSILTAATEESYQHLLASDIAGDVNTSASLENTGRSYPSTIDQKGDQDWFRLLLTPGKKYTFKMSSASGSSVIPLLILRNRRGEILLESDGGTLSYTIPENPSSSAETYFLSAHGRQMTTGNYLISSTPFVDTTVPVLTGTSPSDGQSGVDVSTKIVLTFNEGVRGGSGSITLTNKTTNTSQSLGVSSSSVSFQDKQLIITPPGRLAAGNQFQVTFGAGVVKDTSNNSFSGLSAGMLDFTTKAPVDTVPPTLISCSPKDGSSGVAVGTNIVLTFNEPVKAGSGRVTIAVGGSADVREMMANDSSQVKFSGKTMTIIPSKGFVPGKLVNVGLESSSVLDMAGNKFAGIKYGELDFTMAAPVPVFTVSASSANKSKKEGNSGATNFTFDVTRDDDTVASTVKWAATGSGSCYEGDFASCVFPSGELSFPVGTKTLPITIEVAGDTSLESDENFTVRLTSAKGATIGASNAVIATVVNDDKLPVFKITTSNSSLKEGNSTGATFTFDITRDVETVASSIQWSVTGSGSCTDGDFQNCDLPSGTIDFPVGVKTYPIKVKVEGDRKEEANETFTVRLSSVKNATIGTGTVTATIVNDDVAPDVKFSSTATVRQYEGSYGGGTIFEFPVSRSNYGMDSKVNWEVKIPSDVVASKRVEAKDFMGAIKGTLKFDADDARPQSVLVSVRADTESEQDDEFIVVLTSEEGAKIPSYSSKVRGVIVNDDGSKKSARPERDATTTGESALNGLNTVQIAQLMAPLAGSLGSDAVAALTTSRIASLPATTDQDLEAGEIAMLVSAGEGLGMALRASALAGVGSVDAGCPTTALQATVGGSTRLALLAVTPYNPLQESAVVASYRVSETWTAPPLA
ncbi:MAG: DUF4347 domain-containing protein [Magnetococcus sp. MYC-9]